MVALVKATGNKKNENYFIDTEEIDQIYDGDKFYTIIHENQEIIVSNKDNTFFNFTPNQIFNYFLNGLNGFAPFFTHGCTSLFLCFFFTWC